MNRLVILGVSGTLVVAGCGPMVGGGGGGGGGGGTTFKENAYFSRFIATETDAAGDAIAVVDRSIDEQDLKTTQRLVGGVPRTASVKVDGTMGGGTPVPGDDDLPVDPLSLADSFPTYESEDSFLGEVETGENYQIVKYATQLGNRRYTGYGVDGNETLNMPNVGSATYSGTVNGTVYGSQTRESALSGKLALRAEFDPVLNTVDGRLNDLKLHQSGDTIPLGSDIRLSPTMIGGNGYHGAVRVVQPGTLVEAGTSSFGSYNGAFYGNLAKETGGTFQFSAQNIPIVNEAGVPTGAVENMQGVGAFGGFRP